MVTPKTQRKQSTLKKTVDLENELSVTKSQLVRTLADYDNLRKRTEEEKGLWIKFSTQRVLTTLLPVLDNFESAQKHLNDSGLAIAIGEFKKVFTEEGLEEIDPRVDEVFDHDSCEAVELIETKEDGKDGKIAEVILPGWRYKPESDLPTDRVVIRHAKVKVYKHT
jgi:molecular chaperone GrpE